MKGAPVGIFDSGLGGLSIMRALMSELPEYSYVYLGDSQRAPYGSLDSETMYRYTIQAIQYLFEQSKCRLVIVACNTVSAVVLRRLQQKWLANNYPDRRVLGILVPTIEHVTGIDWETGKREGRAFSSVGVLATEATVESGMYKKEILERTSSASVVQIACPALVPLIEHGASRDELGSAVDECITRLNITSKKKNGRGWPEALILGCTHYSLIADIIDERVDGDTKIFDQPRHVALATRQYLREHPEIDEQLDRKASRVYETTGNAKEVTDIANRLAGGALISFKHVELP